MKIVKLNQDHCGFHHEVVLHKSPWERLLQDLPEDSVVIIDGGRFALDLVVDGKREPYVEEPRPWPEFAKDLGIAQIARRMS